MCLMPINTDRAHFDKHLAINLYDLINALYTVHTISLLVNLECEQILKVLKDFLDSQTFISFFLFPLIKVCLSTSVFPQM